MTPNASTKVNKLYNIVLLRFLNFCAFTIIHLADPGLDPSFDLDFFFLIYLVHPSDKRKLFLDKGLLCTISPCACREICVAANNLQKIFCTPPTQVVNMHFFSALTMILSWCEVTCLTCYRRLCVECQHIGWYNVSLSPVLKVAEVLRWRLISSCVM